MQFLRILRQRLQSTEPKMHRVQCDCASCTPMKLALEVRDIIIFVHHIITKIYYGYCIQLG